MGGKHWADTRSIERISCTYEKNSCNVKYFKNGKIYDDGLKWGEIENQQWAFDWHYELWSQMTLNFPSSRSLKFDIKYFKNGDSYDGGVNLVE